MLEADIQLTLDFDVNSIFTFNQNCPASFWHDFDVQWLLATDVFTADLDGKSAESHGMGLNRTQQAHGRQGISVMLWMTFFSLLQRHAGSDWMWAALQASEVFGKLWETLIHSPQPDEPLKEWFFWSVTLLQLIKLLMSRSWAGGCLPGHRQTNPVSIIPICRDSGEATTPSQTLSVHTQSKELRSWLHLPQTHINSFVSNASLTIHEEDFSRNRP